MDKARLLEQLALSRRAISTDLHRLNEELNYPKKVAESVRTQPVKWLGGALFSGYIFGKLRPRRKPAKPVKKGSAAAEPAKQFGILAVLVGLARFLAPVLRPVLMSYAAKALSKYALR